MSYSAEEMVLIEQEAIKIVPLSSLAKLIQEGFDAVDNTLAKMAVSELLRRTTIIDELADKGTKLGCNTIGIMRVPGSYLVSVGIAGEEEPKVAVQGQFLFQCLEIAARKLP